MSRSFETLRLEVDAHVATLTLNRPEKRNAFNGAMRSELLSAFDDLDRNDDVRCVIVVGEGRAFSAGADLSAGAKAFGSEARSARAGISDPHGDRDGGGIIALRIYESLKPVIGAINGAAVGAGVTMTLPMDMRLASTEAKFGFVFTQRGIVLESASSYFLPRIVGVSTALEWCMSGQMVTADEALAGGLVRSIHTPETLMPAARAIAQKIVQNNAPVSVSLTRHMIWSALSFDHPMEAHRLESDLIKVRGASLDASEGVGAFLEKRPAVFKNKVSSDMPKSFPWTPTPPFQE